MEKREVRKRRIRHSEIDHPIDPLEAGFDLLGSHWEKIAEPADLVSGEVAE